MLASAAVLSEDIYGMASQYFHVSFILRPRHTVLRLAAARLPLGREQKAPLSCPG